MASKAMPVPTGAIPTAHGPIFAAFRALVANPSYGEHKCWCMNQEQSLI